MHSPVTRPVIYDYRSPSHFLQEMLNYRKATQTGFSIRDSLKKVRGCSPSLVTQVLKGRRTLKRDQLPAFAHIFQLTQPEIDFIDNTLTLNKIKAFSPIKTPLPSTLVQHEPRNHLLQDWLNAYVKDTCQLSSFRLDSQTIFRLLGGIASSSRIQKSIEFLFSEGFWRITDKKKVVVDESAVVTTQNIPNKKIRAFHKQALKIALRGLDAIPSDRRKAATVLVTVNQDSLEELKSLIQKFQNDLLSFIEKHPEGHEQLYQVAIHLTPLGGIHAD